MCDSRCRRTRQTIQPSSLLSLTLSSASWTPGPHLNFPPRPTTARRLLSSAKGSRAARFASAASASRTSARAASEAERGGGELRWFRCALSAAGVRSFCRQLGYKRLAPWRSSGGRQRRFPGIYEAHPEAMTHERGSEPVVLEVGGSQGFHQARSRARLQHLGPDLPSASAEKPIGLSREKLTPASSGTNVIIIHSYLPISLLSRR